MNGPVIYLARPKRKNYMDNTAKKKAATADEIAELAMKGEDLSRFFYE